MLAKRVLVLAAAAIAAASPVAEPEPNPVADPAPAPIITVGPEAASIIRSDWNRLFYDIYTKPGPVQASVISLFDDVYAHLSADGVAGAFHSFRQNEYLTFVDFVNNPSPAPVLAPQVTDLPVSLADAYIAFEDAKILLEHSIAVSVAKSLDRNGGGGGGGGSISIGGGGSSTQHVVSPFSTTQGQHHSVSAKPIGGGGGGSATPQTSQHHTTHKATPVTVVRTVTPSSSLAKAPVNTGVAKAAGLALGAVGAAAILL